MNLNKLSALALVALLSVAAELVNIQGCQVPFFHVAHVRRNDHCADCGVYICRGVVMQLFILTSKSARLNCLIAHARLRG